MLVLKPLSREQMRANWARVRVPGNGEEPAPKPAPPALNLRATLDLGELTYFTFRGRAYGIPPLPWKQGERILAEYQTIRRLGEVTEKNHAEYYAAFAKLVPILWRNCRPHASIFNPGGHLRWLLHRLRLLPNHFQMATEGEIAALALFMLSRRMKGGEQMMRRLIQYGGTS